MNNKIVEQANYFLEDVNTTLPNENSLGKPIAQTEEALKNFWNWFGDSNVVDDRGRPLVVYHGSYDDFYEFTLPWERDDDYYSQEGYDGGNLGYGFYFTDDAQYAKRFGTVKEYYIRIENILDTTNEDVLNEIKDRKKEFDEYGDGYIFGEWGEIVDELQKERKCDGVYGIDVGGFSRGASEYKIIKSNQAKLITNKSFGSGSNVNEDVDKGKEEDE